MSRRGLLVHGQVVTRDGSIEGLAYLVFGSCSREQIFLREC